MRHTPATVLYGKTNTLLMYMSKGKPFVSLHENIKFIVMPLPLEVAMALPLNYASNDIRRILQYDLAICLQLITLVQLSRRRKTHSTRSKAHTDNLYAMKFSTNVLQYTLI